MGTMARIAILKTDGTVNSTTVQYDGYTHYTGVMLANHYREANKVKALIGNGMISTLHEEVVDCDENTKHSFSNRVPGVTVFYKRDRGDMHAEMDVSANINEFYEMHRTQFMYIFDESQSEWFLKFEGCIIHLKQGLTEAEANEIQCIPGCYQTKMHPNVTKQKLEMTQK
jgi:hypothetical protein